MIKLVVIYFGNLYVVVVADGTLSVISSYFIVRVSVQMEVLQHIDCPNLNHCLKFNAKFSLKEKFFDPVPCQSISICKVIDA